MLGMYSIAVDCFRRSHPVDATVSRRSAESARTRRSDTDHPDVLRVGSAEDVDDALLVPLGPDLGHPETEAVVREVPVEDRLSKVWKPAREEEGGERHRAADQDPAFERDRDEGRKRDHRLPAHVEGPVDRRGPDLEKE